MITLGLTGGIGMGKTTAAAMLAELGIPVVDTDVVARQIVEPGQPALVEIQRVFGPGMVGPDGRLRRDALAQHVFSDPVARQQLEAILHPRIREIWRVQTEDWARQGYAIGVVVIPLLFEVGAQDELDATVCVACSAETQTERLRARGWAPTEIEQRIQSQWPVSRKMEHSDFVVWTEGTLESTCEQLKRIVEAI